MPAKAIVNSNISVRRIVFGLCAFLLERYEVMRKNTERIDCSDIYKKETEKSIRTLKLSRDFLTKLNSTSLHTEELFQYADPDFYYYRGIVKGMERDSLELLTNILYEVMERYNKPIEEPGDAPFAFILNSDNKRTGYTFDDFIIDEDVNAILKEHNLDNAVFLCTYLRSSKSGKADRMITNNNRIYQEEGKKLKEVAIDDFFVEQFGAEEWKAFLSSIEHYLQGIRSIIGYQSIKFLSSMNLTMRKIFEEKVLTEWNYKNYRFQIIDSGSAQTQKFISISRENAVTVDHEELEKNYIAGERFRTMLGTNEYAESFITSEWLYHSLKGQKNFDFTAVISGYLKSIEQLLYQIVMLNIDNGCKVAMNKKLYDKAYKNNVAVYEEKNGSWVALPVIKNRNNKLGYKHVAYPYVELTTDQKDYMDSSIGTFEYFLRNNPHIFSKPGQNSTIADMISCFRTEYRNGYFHTHNLQDWNIVEKTRDNAIYLYFVLLGSCIIPNEKKNELGILVHDTFDELCLRIREFKHRNNPRYIFEYDDGSRKKFIYDFLNNTAEYTDEGVEHYERLLFLEVEAFEGALEQITEGVREEQKVYLTRDNLPCKIYRVHRKNKNYELEQLL